jgi:hypothetical protein
MKNIRIELKLTAVVYTGDDAGEEHMADAREPDAVECITLATVRPLSAFTLGTSHAHDVAGGLLAQMLANTAPTMGARLNHTLRKKGL